MRECSVSSAQKIRPEDEYTIELLFLSKRPDATTFSKAFLPTGRSVCVFVKYRRDAWKSVGLINLQINGVLLAHREDLKFPEVWSSPSPRAYMRGVGPNSIYPIPKNLTALLPPQGITPPHLLPYPKWLRGAPPLPTRGRSR